MAQDKGYPPLSRTVEVQIDVVDRANNPPVWDHNVYGPIYVKENMPVGGKVVSIKARSVWFLLLHATNNINICFTVCFHHFCQLIFLHLPSNPYPHFYSYSVEPFWDVISSSCSLNYGNLPFDLREQYDEMCVYFIWFHAPKLRGKTLKIRKLWNLFNRISLEE